MKTDNYFNIKLIIILFILILNSKLLAQQLTADEIMAKYDAQRNSKSEKVDVTMKLINSRGKERIRKIKQYTITDNKRNRSSLIRFLSPGDVEGTGFLSVEYNDRDDDQWLYLPALKKVRRISASDKSDNFMGSDFTFEDLGLEDLQDYKYTLIGSEKINDNDCYVIQAVPDNDNKRKSSGYNKRELFIHKDNFVAIKVNFYNKKDALFKVFIADNVQKIKNADIWRAHLMKFDNIKTKHKTILILENFEVNSEIDKDVFTKRYLSQE